MPKHIASGLRYLAAIKLRKQGLSQQEIANELNINRSTISHYLNGRNISKNAIDFAKVITELNTQDFLLIIQNLFENVNEIRIYTSIFKNETYKGEINDSCIGCGLCVDLCITKAISLDSLKAEINSMYCCGCRVCEEACPTDSIKVYGE